MAPPRKKISTAPPEERVEAEIVSDDFEQQPNDEVVAAGEHVDPEAIEEGRDLMLSAPSVAMNPYVSEEEQGMEMRPTIVGPPAYGSPDPITSVGKLVSLQSHPLSPDVLPEGHPAALSEDYGEGYDGTLKGDATVQSAPVAAQTSSVHASDAARELAQSEGVDLNQVEGTGKDGNVTKGDVEDFIAERDQNDQQDEGQNP